MYRSLAFEIHDISSVHFKLFSSFARNAVSYGCQSIMFSKPENHWEFIKFCVKITKFQLHVYFSHFLYLEWTQIIISPSCKCSTGEHHDRPNQFPPYKVWLPHLLICHSQSKWLHCWLAQNGWTTLWEAQWPNGYSQLFRIWWLLVWTPASASMLCPWARCFIAHCFTQPRWQREAAILLL